WKEAAEHFDRALARRPDDAEALYYRGVAARAAADDHAARFFLWQAARTPEFARAARSLLAEMAAAGGDDASARALLGETPDDGRGRALLAALNRHAGIPDSSHIALHGSPRSAWELRECYLAAAAVAQQDPEAFRDATGKASLEALRQEWQDLIRREPETYLEIAHDYASVGLLNDAIEVLREAAAVSTAPPILCYTLGWLLERAGHEVEAEKWFAKGRALPVGASFPHRAESIPVLTRAIEREPEDGQARLLLGTLLYARGRKEEAVRLWDEAIAREPNHALLRRNRGWAAWRCGDLDAAAAHYDAALAAEPEEFHRYVERDRIAEARNEDPAERLARLQGAPASVRRRGDVAAREAALLVRLGRFEAAISLLEQRRFHPWEGALGMRRLYVDAHVGHGMAHFSRGDVTSALRAFQRALEYPRHIGVGKPARPHDAEPLTLAGIAAAQGGREHDAAPFWEQAAAEVYPQPAAGWFYQSLSLARLGRHVEARERAEALARHAGARVEKTPEDGEGHFLLGLALLALGRVAEAHGHLDRVLTHDPYHFRARFWRTREAPPG
ncbi:MAG: tetratricopeptide repeat protein, partial [Armatimonadota bacterium]|nr:tetratricopeptide repeat protein [Armatimonadota bacterium]